VADLNELGISLMMLGSAGMYLTRQPPLVEAFTHLGSPLYFMTILGVAKLLGALALAIPLVPRGVKEWAYAGFVFNLIAAIASHLIPSFLNSASLPLAQPFTDHTEQAICSAKRRPIKRTWHEASPNPSAKWAMRRA
jgi:uncharacterized membrane protein YphA (DoxX/SURF4 family)